MGIDIVPRPGDLPYQVKSLTLIVETLNIIPVNITSFTVTRANNLKDSHAIKLSHLLLYKFHYSVVICCILANQTIIFG